MKLVKKTLNKLNGLHYPQEYLCVAKETFPQPPRLYLAADRHVIRDITLQHCFTGYNPLLFTLHSLPADLLQLSSITLVFSHQLLQPNEVFSHKDAIATLTLQKIQEQDTGEGIAGYYEAILGRHHFISPFYQWITGLYNRLYNKKPGNVFLPGNLYTQVQIAYSLPRAISLITVGRDERFNLFPTDLHGPAGEQHYVISLRHAGKACRQVEASGQIVLSAMHCDARRTVYGLGKNHMQELKPKDQFPFSSAVSGLFQLPLPEAALSYRELELQDSFIYGIHKLLLFKVVAQQQVSTAPFTLAHVHNSYATWRYNNRLEGNYLLR